MSLHGKNLIGPSATADGSTSFQATNPATGETLPTAFHHATADEIERALDLADRAFCDSRNRDPKQTAALLERSADEIEALGNELIERGGAETGLPAGRLKMERGRTCGQLRLFAQLVGEGSWVDARIDRAQPRRKPIPKPDVRRMLVPLGPVVVFPASNFPLAFSTAGGDTASAFAAGCPVIVKARPQHPGTSELVGQAVQKAVAAVGMPDGWFSMLHGPGRELGMTLVRHRVVKAVGFTGSLAGGRALFDAACARPDPIPVYAEMGSINPVFLLPDALADRADDLAAGMHQSLTLGVGQFCTNPGLVVAVDDENLARFMAALEPLVRQTPPATMLMASIRDAYESGVGQLADIDGVQQTAQAEELPDTAKTHGAAAVFATDANVFIRDRRLREEVFGPATLVVKCRDTRQMLEVAQCLEGQLTATVHGTEAELTNNTDLLAAIEQRAGRVLVGGFPTGVEVCASMNHGGPYPATTDGRTTSVGTAAIYRFARPVCYQDYPQQQLPPELRDRNERGIWRLVDNKLTRDDLT